MSAPDMGPASWQWDRSADGAIGSPPDPPGWFHLHRLAAWPFRVVAGAIDYGLFFILPFACLSGDFNKVAFTVALGCSMFNSGFLAAWTTQSLGKRLMGIRMVWVKKGRDQEYYVVKVPVWVGIIRVPLHVLDYALCGIGFLLPLVNRSRGTLADLVTRTLNYRDPRLPDPEENVVGVCDWP